MTEDLDNFGGAVEHHLDPSVMAGELAVDPQLENLPGAEAHSGVPGTLAVDALARELEYRHPQEAPSAPEPEPAAPLPEVTHQTLISDEELVEFVHTHRTVHVGGVIHQLLGVERLDRDDFKILMKQLRRLKAEGLVDSVRKNIFGMPGATLPQATPAPRPATARHKPTYYKTPKEDLDDMISRSGIRSNGMPGIKPKQRGRRGR